MSSNGNNIQKSLALDYETTVQDLILDSIQDDSGKISLSIKSNVLASVQGMLLKDNLGLLIGNFEYLGKKTPKALVNQSNFSRLDLLGLTDTRQSGQSWRLESDFYLLRVLDECLGLFQAREKNAAEFRLLFYHSETGIVVIGTGNYRFHDKYAKQQMAKLWFLQKLQPTAFLTLTFDPKRGGVTREKPVQSIEQARKIWKGSGPAWHNLCKYVRKKWGILPTFWAVWESQQNGFPHIHVVFFSLIRDEVWIDMARWWNERHGFVKLFSIENLPNGKVRQTEWRWKSKNKEFKRGKTKDYRLGNFMARYMMKYLSKLAPLMQKVMMTVFRKRSFSMSEDLQIQKKEHEEAWIQESKDKGWTLLDKFWDRDLDYPAGTQLTQEEYKADVQLQRALGKWWVS